MPLRDGASSSSRSAEGRSSNSVQTRMPYVRQIRLRTMSVSCPFPTDQTADVVALRFRANRLHSCGLQFLDDRHSRFSRRQSCSAPRPPLYLLRCRSLPAAPRCPPRASTRPTPQPDHLSRQSATRWHATRAEIIDCSHWPAACTDQH